MKLRLRDNTVTRLLFVDAEGRKIESGFALRFKPIFDENPREFSVLFDFYYITENDRALRVEFQSVFETDKDIGGTRCAAIMSSRLTFLIFRNSSFAATSDNGMI